MRQIAMLLLVLAASASGQTGRITGTVVDDSGTPIQGATVTAALWQSAQPIPFVAGKLPAFMPVPANALSGSQGDFEVDGLYAGNYYICVEKASASILNPCLWADAPVVAIVPPGTTGATRLTVVAARGTTVNVRVQDTEGLLSANPALDDIRVGTSHRTSPFIPGLVAERDPAGRTMGVIVPLGQAASISISSAYFSLAGQTGVPLASTTVSVPASTVTQGGTAPAITIQVTGTTGAHP